MVTFTLLDILKVLVLVAGVVDAYKYYRQSQKVLRTKSSRDVSRMFVLIAIVCDLVIITYCVVIRDIVLTIIRLISLFTMCLLFWNVYKFYPFRMRGLRNFRKPPFLKFLWNALLPNSIRKRL